MTWLWVSLPTWFLHFRSPIWIKAESTTQYLYKSKLNLYQSIILSSERPGFPLTIYKLVKVFEMRSVVLSDHDRLNHTDAEKVNVEIGVLHDAYNASVKHYDFQEQWKQQKMNREKINTVLSPSIYQWKILHSPKCGPSFLAVFKRHREGVGSHKFTIYEEISWTEAFNVCTSLGGSLPFTRSMDDVQMLVALVQHKAFNLRMPIFLGIEPQVTYCVFFSWARPEYR